MIGHVAHALPTRPKAQRMRTTAPPSAAPAVAEETPHSSYLRLWISRHAARHGELLQTIAAAPRPPRVGPGC